MNTSKLNGLRKAAAEMRRVGATLERLGDPALAEQLNAHAAGVLMTIRAHEEGNVPTQPEDEEDARWWAMLEATFTGADHGRRFTMEELCAVLGATVDSRSDVTRIGRLARTIGARCRQERVLVDGVRRKQRVYWLPTLAKVES